MRLAFLNIPENDWLRSNVQCLVSIVSSVKRLARAYPEGVDFFEVDFSRCKPLSKHCDITMLPTGIILKQGKLVEHAPIRSSDFKAFKGQLAVHAEDSSAPPALGVSSSFGI